MCLTTGREELRARFLKVEALLFKIRFEEDSLEERKQFLDTLSFDWIPVRFTNSTTGVIRN